MSIISDIEALRFLREPSYSKRVGSIVNAIRDHTDMAKAQQKRIDMLENYQKQAADDLVAYSSRIDALKLALEKLADGTWWDGNEPRQCYRMESYAKSALEEIRRMGNQRTGVKPTSAI